MHTPIDVVVTWVDGKEIEYKNKLSKYIKEHFGTDIPGEDIAGNTRYDSMNEIYFCISSILKFAPFIRKIFIVTDNQNPNLDSFIENNFPQRDTEISIIDHSVVFKDYEDFLPIFNSLSIETLLWRIPDLSENFIYFNDDFCLVRDVKPTDWFRDDKPVVYGSHLNTYLVHLLRMIKPRRNGKKPFGFKDSMLNAIKILGYKRNFLAIEHTPLPLKRSVFEEFFKDNPELIELNLKHKFRNHEQFNPQCLFYNILLRKKLCVIESDKNHFLCIKPVGRSKNYTKRKIDLFKRTDKIKFFCVNSLDQASQNDKQLISNWLTKTINIYF
ncbi:MAG: hypothetical protein Q4F97_10605 [Bacteroidales bacterium]|nr:hypothetical protein [Bacteroidales bacterium]